MTTTSTAAYVAGIRLGQRASRYGNNAPAYFVPTVFTNDHRAFERGYIEGIAR